MCILTNSCHDKLYLLDDRIADYVGLQNEHSKYLTSSIHWAGENKSGTDEEVD